MRKKDLFILLFVFSLFFVDLIPLNVNLLNNTFVLSLNNITTYFYIGLSLYVLYHVLPFFKNNGLESKLINMYTFGYLLSLFLVFYTFNIGFINHIYNSSDVFVLFFGQGNRNSTLAIIVNIVFNIIFLVANLGLYFLIIYPIFVFSKKVKSQFACFKFLNLSFLIFVASKTLFVFFDFLINITSLQLNITTLNSIFLFFSWLLNVVAILSLIVFKIFVIYNIYLKITNRKEKEA